MLSIDKKQIKTFDHAQKAGYQLIEIHRGNSLDKGPGARLKIADD